MKRSSSSADNMIALPSDRVSRSDFFVRFTSRQGSASDNFVAAAHVSGAPKNFFPEMIKKVLTSEYAAFIMQAEKSALEVWQFYCRPL